MDDDNDVEPGAPEGSALPTYAPHAGRAEAGQGKRFSAKRKLAAVQRLLRGESLEALSRELNVPAHRLSDWRDRVLIAAESLLKGRDPAIRNRKTERQSTCAKISISLYLADEHRDSVLKTAQIRWYGLVNSRTAAAYRQEKINGDGYGKLIQCNPGGLFAARIIFN